MTDIVEEFWNKAKDLNLIPAHKAVPEVFYDLKGARAGEASCIMYPWGIFYYRIRLNTELLSRVSAEEVRQTVGHEVAHLVANDYFKERCGHGRKWRWVMSRLGLKPDRCHNYDITGLVRRQKRLDINCRCGVQFSLSQTMVNKIKRGQRRVCNNCRSLVCIP